MPAVAVAVATAAAMAGAAAGAIAVTPAASAAPSASTARSAAAAATSARPAPAATDIAWVWDHHAPPLRATAWAVTVTQLQLTPDGIEERPRLRGLPSPAGRSVTPVVHVDPVPVPRRGLKTGELYDGGPAAAASHLVTGPRPLSALQQTAIAERVTQAATRSTSGWVQLDFEAVPSQRDSYHALIRRVRSALPPTTRLSVTLLAWQCRSKAWIDPINADEVVPMFFRLGRDTARWQRELAEGAPRLHPRCRNEAAGFSPQDTPPADWQRRWPKRYWFNLAPGRSTDWPAAAEARIWAAP